MYPKQGHALRLSVRYIRIRARVAPDKMGGGATKAAASPSTPTPIPLFRAVEEIPNATLDAFELGATLGVGAFGRVYFATHKEHRSHWALKQLKKDAVMKGEQHEHVKRERAILAMIAHPFVVTLAAAFQDVRHLYFVLEFVAGGEFDTHLKAQGFLFEGHVRFYCAQLVLIFEYLHSSSTGGIVFRKAAEPDPGNRWLLEARGLWLRQNRGRFAHAHLPRNARVRAA